MADYTWYKQIHEVPDFYLDMDINKVSSGIKVTLNKFHIGKYGGRFGYTFKARLCYQITDTATSSLSSSYDGKWDIISLKQGELDSKFGSAKDYNSVLPSTRSHTFSVSSTKKGYFRLYVEIQCQATQYDGCDLIGGSPDKGSTLKYHRVPGTKAIKLYTAPSSPSLTLTSTGKTITAKLSWTKGSNTSTGTIKLDTESGSSTSSPYTKTFKGLTMNKLYTVNYTVSDGSTKLTGSKTIYTKFTKVSLVQGSTKNVKLEVKGSSDKSIIMTLDNKKANGDSYSSTFTGQGATLMSKTIKGLKHNTQYTITCKLDEYDDTVSTLTFNTNKLGLKCTKYLNHQDSIETWWQATSNNVNIDKDPIDSVAMKYSTTTGVMDGKYCNYTDLDPLSMNKVSVSVTDGVNTVTASTLIQTSYPYIYIYHNGTWHRAAAYVYKNGSWKLTRPFINSSKE